MFWVACASPFQSDRLRITVARAEACGISISFFLLEGAYAAISLRCSLAENVTKSLTLGKYILTYGV